MAVAALSNKYLICCNFGKLIDILKQFNMYHIFILNSNDGDTFNMEELDEVDYNHVICYLTLTFPPTSSQLLWC